MMVDRENNLYTRQIEELEEQVEYWRQRAESAEAACRGSVEPGVWSRRVKPLTLFETRIMRLLALRDMSAEALALALEDNYPHTSVDSIKVHLTNIRSRLPSALAPPRGQPCKGTSHLHTVPDREALKAFLETGVLPGEQMRVAA